MSVDLTASTFRLLRNSWTEGSQKVFHEFSGCFVFEHLVWGNVAFEEIETAIPTGFPKASELLLLHCFHCEQGGMAFSSQAAAHFPDASVLGTCLAKHQVRSSFVF